MLVGAWIELKNCLRLVPTFEVTRVITRLTYSKIYSNVLIITSIFQRIHERNIDRYQTSALAISNLKRIAHSIAIHDERVNRAKFANRKIKTKTKSRFINIADEGRIASFLIENYYERSSSP